MSATRSPRPRRSSTSSRRSSTSNRSSTASRSTSTRRRSTTNRWYPTRRRRRPGLSSTVGSAIGMLAVTTLLNLSWPARIGLLALVVVMGLGYMLWRHRGEIAAAADPGSQESGIPHDAPNTPQDQPPTPEANPQ